MKNSNTSVGEDWSGLVSLRVQNINHFFIQTLYWFFVESLQAAKIMVVVSSETPVCLMVFLRVCKPKGKVVYEEGVLTLNLVLLKHLCEEEQQAPQQTCY